MSATVDSTKSSASPAHPSTDHDDTIEAHYASLERGGYPLLLLRRRVLHRPYGDRRRRRRGRDLRGRALPQVWRRCRRRPLAVATMCSTATALSTSTSWPAVGGVRSVTPWKP